MQNSQNSSVKVNTIEVSLPSKGNLYPQSSILSKGKLNLRYMTGKDEDIFSNVTYIKNNDTMFQLLKALVTDDGFNPYDLVMSDMLYLIVAIRIMALGANINLKDVSCPKCGHIEPSVVLSLADIEENPSKISPDIDNTNLFTITLPQSKKVVVLKVITGNDAKELDKNMKKAQASNISRLFTLVTSAPIVSIDGVDVEKNMGDKLNFVDNLSIVDARAIRQHIVDISGATEGMIPYECKSCGHKSSYKLSIDESFFFPEL